MYGSPIKCEFWCMSPTCAQQPVFCFLQETDADDYDRICLTWLSFRWVVTAPRATAQVSSAFISSVERLRTQAQQLLPPTVQGDRLVQGLADSRMHAASTPRDDCARVLLYFSWGGGGVGSESSSITVHNRLHYMRFFQFALLFSPPGPICCCFNCLFLVEPTATPARRALHIS